MSKKVWAIGFGSALLLTGGAYTAAYFVAGDKVPSKATAGGIAIGGLSPQEAEAKLAQELGSRVTTPITFTTPHGESGSVTPNSAGLAINYAASVEAAGGGFSWNPVNLYTALTGGEAVDLVYSIDNKALTDAVSAEAPKLKLDPIPAGIALVEGEVKVTKAESGYELQVDSTADKVREAFEAGKSTAEPVGSEQKPPVSDEQVKAFQDGELAEALSAPVKLTSSAGNIELTVEELKKTLVIEGEGPEFKIGYSPEALAEVTKDDLKAMEREGPKNASYKFSNGTVTVVPGKKGKVVNTESVAKALVEALAAEERTAALEATEEEPKFSTAKAEQLKPKQVIGEFTTRYPHAAYRNTNIGQAARKVNGSVLWPGETFSMNGTVGERTAANGFTSGYVIQGGVLVKEWGGGVSQAATTLFNAAFFAGMTDVEHKPHSLYFPRYPAGREATLYYGSVDLRFRNDTEYPILIQGYTSPSSPGKQGSVTFRIWSIPTYDSIKSSELRKSNFTYGRERVSKAPNCEPQAPIRGFTVNYERIFTKNGKVVKREPFRWTYNAGDRITCA